MKVIKRKHQAVEKFCDTRDLIQTLTTDSLELLYIEKQVILQARKIEIGGRIKKLLFREAC